MRRGLGDFNFETVLVNLENIIIFSTTFKDQVQHLDRVLVKNTRIGETVNWNQNPSIPPIGWKSSLSP